MARALYLPADLAEPVRFREVATLESLQAAVGGYIQALRFTLCLGGQQQDVTLYVNEDGKAKALPRNARATAMVERFLFAGDFICGNVLLLGPIRRGENTDVPMPECFRVDEK